MKYANAWPAQFVLAATKTQTIEATHAEYYTLRPDEENI